MQIINQVLNNIEYFVIPSPLDQFGDDDDDEFNLFNIELLFLGTIPGLAYIESFLDFLGIGLLTDEDEWISIALSNAGSLFFDDEDTDSSEFEDSDEIISSLQSSIFISNALVMVPGTETITSDSTFTFMISISTMIMVIITGFTLHHIRFFAILYPTGTPIIMAPFIILIEFVSFLARAIILGMRLFANMFAVHSLVKILMSFSWLFLNSSLTFLSIPVILLILVIFFMEVGIAYLQAYVFGALAGMYFEDAILLGH